jgi:hypothetical protein
VGWPSKIEHLNHALPDRLALEFLMDGHGLDEGALAAVQLANRLLEAVERIGPLLLRKGDPTEGLLEVPINGLCALQAGIRPSCIMNAALSQ